MLSPPRPRQSLQTKHPQAKWVRGSLIAAFICIAWLLAPQPATASANPALPTGITTAPVGISTSNTERAEDTESVWSWPLSPVPDVTRPFDLPHPYGAGHRGVDLSAAPGAPVFAPGDGVVHFAGTVVDRPVLSIKHPNGLISSFEPVVATVSKGDAVSRGELVGHVSTDHVHAPVGGLHLGARDGETYIDPLALLGAVPRAILLPLGAG